MIIGKQPLPDDPTPPEAPPSYDTIQSQRATSSYSQNEKVEFSIPAPSPPLPSGPLPSPALSQTSPIPPSSKASKGKASKSWFAFGQAARTAKDVRSTVLTLVRDVVKLQEADASIALLGSCAEACRAHDISFSSILQEKSIENHTPIYWAIINRPPEPLEQEDPDLLTALLSRADPLTDESMSEIRLACLQTSDQALFQRLRRSSAFAPLSGTDQMLLSASIPPDIIEVEDAPGDEGAFVVHCHIMLFQKRMRISNLIDLEFIARGRMWSLKFLIGTKEQWETGIKPGTWMVSLSLLDHSPPTWIDSRLIIEDSLANRRPSQAVPHASPSSPQSCDQRLKPTINLRLKTGGAQLAPRKPASSTHRLHDIFVSLDESLMGNSLQYDGSSYISSDGSLQVRLEARLAKPEADCIVC